MTEQEVKKFISDQREKFVPIPEEKKSIRFMDDDYVVRVLRMEMFQQMNLKQLPTINQFYAICTDKFLEKNTFRALKEVAGRDYHYSNPEKWVL
jgi:hypothetical protein